MHPLNQADSEALHSLLRLAESEPLPPALEQAYREVKRIKDGFLPGPLSPEFLAFLVWMTETAAKPEPEEHPLHTLIKRGEVKYDHPLSVTWRKETVAAKYRDYSESQGKVQVLIEGQSAERWLGLDAVVGGA